MILEVKGIIKKWKERYLTPLGKVSIDIYLTLYMYVLLTLLKSNETFIKELKDILFKFILCLYMNMLYVFGLKNQIKLTETLLPWTTFKSILEYN